MNIYHLDDIPDDLKSYFKPIPQLGLEKSPEEYVAAMVGVFREVRRVLADDGTLFLNLGDSYTSGGRDTFGPVVDGTKQATQPAIKFTKRAAQPIGLKPKDLVGIPWRVAFALQADGWYLRSDIIWAKPNPMPESVTDRPTKAHEYVFLLSKSQRYFYDAGAIKESSSQSTIERAAQGTGMATSSVTSKHRLVDGSDRAAASSTLFVRDFKKDALGRNARSVWTIPTQATPEAHFATFPEALAERCILAGSAQGDTVLDPFFGSGTVGKVAERLGRKWVGIELNPAYVEISERKTAQRGIFT